MSISNLLPKNLTDLLERKEELNEELAPYLNDSGPFLALQHPLIYSVPHFSELNAIVNARYHMISQANADNLSKGDYIRYLLNHERPWRLDAFEKIQDKLSNKQYWETLSWIYIDCENIWQNYDVWNQLLFDTKRKGKSAFMNVNERRVFKSLPNLIKIYRGVSSNHKEGISWTTDKSKATWFPQRFSALRPDGAKLIIAHIHKSKVLAYLNSREESEIVCRYADVQGITSRTL